MGRKLAALSLIFYLEYESNMIHRNVTNIFQHYVASPYIKTWNCTTQSCALSFSEFALYSTWRLQFSHYVFFLASIKNCSCVSFPFTPGVSNCIPAGTVEGSDLLNLAVVSTFGWTKSWAFVVTDNEPSYKILTDFQFIIISPLNSGLWSCLVH
jgi:hypothetical protein